MKQRDVWISIKGKQTGVASDISLSGEDDGGIVEMLTGGKLSAVPGGYLLTYLENDTAGLGETRTSLVVRDGTVTLLRQGDVTAHMVFEQGRRHLSYYDTEHGALTVGVNTRRMTSTLSDDGGDIEMEYQLEIDHKVSGANFISIHVDKDDMSAGELGTISHSPDDRFLH